MGQVLERHAVHRGARIGIVRRHVAPSQLQRVHAQLGGGQFNQPLGDRGGDRVADGAVAADHRLVLKGDAAPGPVIVDHVAAAREVDDLVGLDGAGAGKHGERTGAGEAVEVQGGDPALRRERHPGPGPVTPGVEVSGERLQPVGRELHRPLEQDRQPGDRELIAIDMRLHPESAAHIPADHPDLVLVDPEMGGEMGLHLVRGLGRLMDGERPFAGIEIGDDGPGFHGDAGVAAEHVALFDHHRRLGESPVHVSFVDQPFPEEIVAKLGVDRLGARFQRRRLVGEGGQFPEFDVDQFERIFGQRPALRGHGRHRLALPARPADGERVLGHGLHPRQMAENAGPGPADPGNLLAVHHRRHAGGPLGGGLVDPHDVGVGVGRAQIGHMNHARQFDVVGKDAPAFDQPLNIGPGQALAEIALGASANTLLVVIAHRGVP